MKKPKYTRADMKKLAEMSDDASVAAIFLAEEEINYDPKKFRDLLKRHNLTKDINYLYEMPLNEIPLLINKGEVSGYLQFRLAVGK